jgi:phenylacetic acid degradation operon negative regulatory protein
MSRQPDDPVAEALDTSARSVLLTVLGEFVLPYGGSAWTSTILAALATVEVNERAGRQAILRASRSKWIVTTRSGRRARCQLTDRCTLLLTEGADRIYRFGLTDPSPVGRPTDRPGAERDWLLVVISADSLPGTRHRLRTRLAWHGLGSLAPGVWVTPDAGREAAVVAELGQLGLDGCTFVGRPGSLGLGETGIGQLWDLDSLADGYRAFVTMFETCQPRTDGDFVAALIRLVHHWRRFPFTDPELPSHLLGPDWPGHSAARLFAVRRAEWAETAGEWWQGRERDARLPTRS